MRDKHRGVTISETPTIGSTDDRSGLDKATIGGDRDAFAHAVLQCSPDCLKVLDADGNVLFFNTNGLCAMEIDDIADVVGQAWPSFWPAESSPLAERAVADALAGGVGEFQGFCPTAKGTLKYWDVVVSAVPNPGGATERLIVVSRDITARHEEEERKSALTAELGHRINNTLALIQAIAMQSKRTASDLDTFYEKFAVRLKAMGDASKAIVAATWDGVHLRDLARVQLGTFDSNAVTFDGPDVLIKPENAQALALALNELATNATKYGALSASKGRVALTWVREGDGVRIEWRESGGPPVQAPTRTGLGSALITGIAGAEVDLRYEPDGVVCTIALPV